jgi:hypothetical protein
MTREQKLAAVGLGLGVPIALAGSLSPLGQAAPFWLHVLWWVVAVGAAMRGVNRATAERRSAVGDDSK